MNKAVCGGRKEIRVEQRDTEPPTDDRAKRVAEKGTWSWALSDEEEFTGQK